MIKLLDLFCGAGGCSAGYVQAGFDVAGVDVDYQRAYPYEFYQADAMDTLDDILEMGSEFDVIHASPPCQVYSSTRHTHDVEHPDLLAPVTTLLRRWAEETGGIYIIENVPGAPMINPFVLCGSQFGLTTTDVDGTPLVLRRHRHFDSNVLIFNPECKHDYYKSRGYKIGGVYGGGTSNRERAEKERKGGYLPNADKQRELMGIDWMGRNDLHQAIPPAYTRFIGEQVMEHLRNGK